MNCGHVGLLLFADICWNIAVSPAELQRMSRAWNELLERAGLQIAWQETAWCCSLRTVLRQPSPCLVLRLLVGRGNMASKHWENGSRSIRIPAAACVCVCQSAGVESCVCSRLFCVVCVWLSHPPTPHRDEHGCIAGVLPGPTRVTSDGQLVRLVLSCVVKLSSGRVQHG